MMMTMIMTMMTVIIIIITSISVIRIAIILANHINKTIIPATLSPTAATTTTTKYSSRS